MPGTFLREVSLGAHSGRRFKETYNCELDHCMCELVSLNTDKPCVLGHIAASHTVIESLD